MATLVVYATTADGYLTSSDTSYGTAVAGSGSVTVSAGSVLHKVGQTPGYNIYETFLSFDTSALGPGVTVTAVVLELALKLDNSTTDFLVYARGLDWGTSLTTSDWQTWPAVNSLTYLAQLATSGIGAADAYKAFASDPAFPAYVNRTEATRIVLVTNQMGVSAPATGDYLDLYATEQTGTTFDPRLTITYVAANTPVDLAGTIAGSATVVADLSAGPPAGLGAYSAGTSTVTAALTTLSFGPVSLTIEFRDRDYSGSADTFGPWREITCQAIGASWTRGSPEHRGLLNFPENGQTSLTLLDPDRVLDPGNASGIYYGQIDVGADLRLTFGGRVVFTGRITTINHEFRHRQGEPAMAVANVQAQGYQGKLALIPALALSSDGWNTTWPDEVTYARVNRILDACAVASADRDIQTGGELILDQGHTQAVYAGSAWDVLVTTMMSEIGSIELTAEGRIRTRNRATVWETTPAATLHLGCDAHAGAIPVHEASFETVRDTVRNDVRITVAQNDVYGPVTDAASIAKYGLRKYDAAIGETIIHFGGGSTWVNYFLARMKTPMRTWRVTLRPTTQAQIDALETVPLYTSRAHLVIDDIGGEVIDLNLRPLGFDWSVDPAGSVVVMALGG